MEQVKQVGKQQGAGTAFTVNFRSTWWAVLVLVIGFLLWQRVDAFSSGSAGLVELVVFLIWMGLCLGPLFTTIQLPGGIRLEQKINEVKQDVSRQLESFRLDVRNVVQSRNENAVAQNIHFNQSAAPPPDESLGELRSEVGAIRKVVEALALKQSGVKEPPPASLSADDAFSATEDEVLMFAARKNLELRLRRLAAPFFGSERRSRFIPIPQLLKALVSGEVIDRHVATVISEFYSVTSQAVHGQAVSERQADFVRGAAPDLMATLDRLAADPELGRASLFANPYEELEPG